MIKWLALVLFFLVKTSFSQSTCYLEKDYPLPKLSAEARNSYKAKWEEAREEFEKDSTNVEAIIWLGRRVAYLGNYKEAIDIFTRGIALHPGDARLYRHRGHRYLTLRCFGKAIADFRRAAKLVKGKPDEIEPDGLPNARNIPTSTLQSNIWYHLGLCYFINAEYKKAGRAYKKCLAVSANPDMYVATANWMNIVLRRMKKDKKAMTLYNNMDPNAELIENRDYEKLLQLYRDKPQEQDIEVYAATMRAGGETVAAATLNFGLGYYCLLMGDREKAKSFFEKAIGTGQWSSFGYIAAETELNRL
ncbi:MAG TPA: tetratricopeptide repeat protein [Chitinophagaceae bacterium]|nr:tetratricopeptide repeat protein [Chitinophagaceae bacterium]